MEGRQMDVAPGSKMFHCAYVHESISKLANYFLQKYQCKIMQDLFVENSIWEKTWTKLDGGYIVCFNARTAIVSETSQLLCN